MSIPCCLCVMRVKQWLLRHPQYRRAKQMRFCATHLTAVLSGCFLRPPLSLSLSLCPSLCVYLCVFRLARRYLWKWQALEKSRLFPQQQEAKLLPRGYHAASPKPQAERAFLDHIVRKLLDISKSAIYIRFVWRHLVRYDLRHGTLQDLSSCSTK